MERILVALDGSERAPAVLDEAVRLARRLDAKLILLRVYSLPMGLPLEAYAITPEVLPEVMERDAARSLERLAQRAPRELIAATRVELGVPWQQIVTVAKAEKADLIVVGSHGYHGLDRILGTTAARVVNHAEGSVLVVHRPDWH